MPLSGIRVLDFTQVVAGPFGTQLLGDMGAEVVKVESPDGDRARTVSLTPEGFSSSFFNLNRNKKSLVVNLKSPEGKKVIEGLLDTIDVLVENFKPGTLQRLGFGFTDLNERFPALIYCSISGFGQTGPRRADVAFDQIIQGYSGIMGVTGSEESGPMRVGGPVADLVGGIFASQGILLALQERQRSGLGQWVDVSMLDSMLPLLGFTAWEYLYTGSAPARNGNAHPTLAPSGSFQASDGAFNISLTGEVIWQRFCKALDRQAWINDPRFAGNTERFENSKVLTRLINERLSGKSRAEWIAYFREAEVPCGPIYELDEALADPQIAARGMVRPMQDSIAGEVRVISNPVRLSRTPAQYKSSPPALGEHTQALLSELGYSQPEMLELRASGAVGWPD